MPLLNTVQVELIPVNVDPMKGRISTRLTGTLRSPKEQSVRRDFATA